MIEESRNETLNKLIYHAKTMGANGLIAARYDSDALTANMEEILAHGTAVVVKKNKNNIQQT